MKRIRYFKLLTDIEVNNLKINKGLKLNQFDGNYFHIIDGYRKYYQDVAEIYGIETIDKIIDIFQDILAKGCGRKYVVIVDGLIVSKGSILVSNLGECSIQYNFEGELLQLFEFILDTSSNAFKVVDFNDNIISETKTLTLAKKAFKRLYPYMDDNLIDSFIYKI